MGEVCKGRTEDTFCSLANDDWAFTGLIKDISSSTLSSSVPKQSGKPRKQHNNSEKINHLCFNINNEVDVAVKTEYDSDCKLESSLPTVRSSVAIEGNAFPSVAFSDRSTGGGESSFSNGSAVTSTEFCNSEQNSEIVIDSQKEESNDCDEPLIINDGKLQNSVIKNSVEELQKGREFKRRIKPKNYDEYWQDSDEIGDIYKRRKDTSLARKRSNSLEVSKELCTSKVPNCDLPKIPKECSNSVESALSEKVCIESTEKLVLPPKEQNLLKDFLNVCTCYNIKTLSNKSSAHVDTVDGVEFISFETEKNLNLYTELVQKRRLFLKRKQKERRLLGIRTPVTYCLIHSSESPVLMQQINMAQKAAACAIKSADECKTVQCQENSKVNEVEPDAVESTAPCHTKRKSENEQVSENSKKICTTQNNTTAQNIPKISKITQKDTVLISENKQVTENSKKIYATQNNTTVQNIPKVNKITQKNAVPVPKGSVSPNVTVNGIPIGMTKNIPKQRPIKPDINQLLKKYKSISFEIKPKKERKIDDVPPDPDTLPERVRNPEINLEIIENTAENKHILEKFPTCSSPPKCERYSFRSKSRVRPQQQQQPVYDCTKRDAKPQKAQSENQKQPKGQNKDAKRSPGFITSYNDPYLLEDSECLGVKKNPNAPSMVLYAGVNYPLFPVVYHNLIMVNYAYAKKIEDNDTLVTNLWARFATSVVINDDVNVQTVQKILIPVLHPKLLNNISKSDINKFGIVTRNAFAKMVLGPDACDVDTSEGTRPLRSLETCAEDDQVPVETFRSFHCARTYGQEINYLARNSSDVYRYKLNCVIELEKKKGGIFRGCRYVRFFDDFAYISSSSDGVDVESTEGSGDVSKDGLDGTKNIILYPRQLSAIFANNIATGVHNRITFVTCPLVSTAAARWLILSVENVFTSIVCNKKEALFYGELIEILYRAESSKKVFKYKLDSYKSRYCRDNNVEFGAYAFPGLSKLVLLGPYDLIEKHQLTAMSETKSKRPKPVQIRILSSQPLDRNQFFDMERGTPLTDIDVLWWAPFEYQPFNTSVNEIYLNSFFNIGAFDYIQSSDGHPAEPYSLAPGPSTSGLQDATSQQKYMMNKEVSKKAETLSELPRPKVPTQSKNEVVSVKIKIPKNKLSSVLRDNGMDIDMVYPGKLETSKHSSKYKVKDLKELTESSKRVEKLPSYQSPDTDVPKIEPSVEDHVSSKMLGEKPTRNLGKISPKRKAEDMNEPVGVRLRRFRATDHIEQVCAENSDCIVTKLVKLQSDTKTEPKNDILCTKEEDEYVTENVKEDSFSSSDISDTFQDRLNRITIAAEALRPEDRKIPNYIAERNRNIRRLASVVTASRKLSLFELINKATEIIQVLEKKRHTLKCEKDIELVRATVLRNKFFTLVRGLQSDPKLYSKIQKVLEEVSKMRSLEEYVSSSEDEDKSDTEDEIPSNEKGSTNRRTSIDSNESEKCPKIEQAIDCPALTPKQTKPEIVDDVKTKMANMLLKVKKQSYRVTRRDSNEMKWSNMLELIDDINVILNELKRAKAQKRAVYKHFNVENTDSDEEDCSVFNEKGKEKITKLLKVIKGESVDMGLESGPEMSILDNDTKMQHTEEGPQTRQRKKRAIEPVKTSPSVSTDVPLYAEKLRKLQEELETKRFRMRQKQSEMLQKSVPEGYSPDVNTDNGDNDVIYVSSEKCDAVQNGISCPIPVVLEDHNYCSQISKKPAEHWKCVSILQPPWAKKYSKNRTIVVDETRSNELPETSSNSASEIVSHNSNVMDANDPESETVSRGDNIVETDASVESNIVVINCDDEDDDDVKIVDNEGELVSVDIVQLDSSGEVTLESECDAAKYVEEVVIGELVTESSDTSSSFERQSNIQEEETENASNKCWDKASIKEAEEKILKWKGLSRDTKRKNEYLDEAEAEEKMLKHKSLLRGTKRRFEGWDEARITEAEEKMLKHKSLSHGTKRRFECWDEASRIECWDEASINEAEEKILNCKGLSHETKLSLIQAFKDIACSGRYVRKRHGEPAIKVTKSVRSVERPKSKIREEKLEIDTYEMLKSIMKVAESKIQSSNLSEYSKRQVLEDFRKEVLSDIQARVLPYDVQANKSTLSTGVDPIVRGGRIPKKCSFDSVHSDHPISKPNIVKGILTWPSVQVTTSSDIIDISDTDVSLDCTSPLEVEVLKQDGIEDNVDSPTSPKIPPVNNSLTEEVQKSKSLLVDTELGTGFLEKNTGEEIQEISSEETGFLKDEHQIALPVVSAAGQKNMEEIEPGPLDGEVLKIASEVKEMTTTPEEKVEDLVDTQVNSEIDEITEDKEKAVEQQNDTTDNEGFLEEKTGKEDDLVGKNNKDTLPIEAVDTSSEKELLASLSFAESHENDASQASPVTDFGMESNVPQISTEGKKEVITTENDFAEQGCENMELQQINHMDMDSHELVTMATSCEELPGEESYPEFDPGEDTKIATVCINSEEVNGVLKIEDQQSEKEPKLETSYQKPENCEPNDVQVCDINGTVEDESREITENCNSASTQIERELSGTTPVADEANKI